MERINKRSCTKITALRIAFVPLIILIIFTLTTDQAYSQSCNRQGRTIQNTDMWDRPPKFITGTGWEYGNRVGILSSDTLIYICQEMRIGFGFSTQLWYQIAYWNNQWRYAWVVAGHIRVSSSHNLLNPDQGIIMASVALAQPPVPPGGEEPSSPPPPPQTILPTQSKLLPSEYMFYLSLFALMVIGMIAKVGVDIIESWGSGQVKDYLRKGIIPFFISPMVFLSFMETAKLEFQGQRGFIILLLLAFQNGFFWQTVFSTKVTGRGSR